jgi:hypothetical protein
MEIEMQKIILFTLSSLAVTGLIESSMAAQLVVKNHNAVTMSRATRNANAYAPSRPTLPETTTYSGGDWKRGRGMPGADYFENDPNVFRDEQPIKSYEVNPHGG